jgi:hypothetical protein
MCVGGRRHPWRRGLVQVPPTASEALEYERDQGDIRRCGGVGDDSHLVFYYVLENTTNADYRVQEPSGTSILGRLKTENSLTPPIVKLVEIDYPIFIPAKQRGRYSISLQPYKYPGGKLKDDASKEERDVYRKAISAYVNEKLNNLDGFVLFDETNRYEINFPKGW